MDKKEQVRQMKWIKKWESAGSQNWQQVTHEQAKHHKKMNDPAKWSQEEIKFIEYFYRKLENISKKTANSFIEPLSLAFFQYNKEGHDFSPVEGPITEMTDAVEIMTEGSTIDIEKSQDDWFVINIYEVDRYYSGEWYLASELEGLQEFLENKYFNN